MSEYYVDLSRGIKAPDLTADPVSGLEAGLIYYNTTMNLYRWYNGTIWVSIELPYFTSIITPPAFAVTQNNYNPTGLQTADVLRLTSTGNNSITGIVAPSPVASVTKRLINIGSGNITMINGSASSSAGNRFSSGANRAIGGGEALDIWYDITETRWKIITNI